MRFVTSSLTALLLVLCTIGTASGQDRPGGLYVEGALGINGITSDEYFGLADSLQVDPVIGLGAAAFYRLHRYASVGLSTYYGFLYPHSDNAGGTYGGFLSLVAAGRAHVTLGRLEPFVSLGFGYATNHTSGSSTLIIGEPEFGLDLHGFGIDLSIGLWISITEKIAVGPFARFVFALWAKGCPRFTFGDLDDQSCDGMDDLYPDPNPRFPHLWIVGAQVSYHLLDGPMVRRRSVATGDEYEADGSLGGSFEDDPDEEPSDSDPEGADSDEVSEGEDSHSWD